VDVDESKLGGGLFLSIFKEQNSSLPLVNRLETIARKLALSTLLRHLSRPYDPLSSS
jgi:hypothetical protein